MFNQCDQWEKSFMFSDSLVV